MHSDDRPAELFLDWGLESRWFDKPYRLHAYPMRGERTGSSPRITRFYAQRPLPCRKIIVSTQARTGKYVDYIRHLLDPQMLVRPPDS